MMDPRETSEPRTLATQPGDAAHGARPAAQGGEERGGRYDHNIEAELERRKRFLRFGEEDVANLKALAPAADRLKHEVAKKFYEHMRGHETSRFLLSERHVENLKRTQASYFEKLFRGEYGAEYGLDRLRVGRTHERIGLGPEWYIGAYCLYICEMLPLVIGAYDDPEEALPLLRSLIKVISLDMGLSMDTYIEALQDRQQQQVRTFVDVLTRYSDGLGEASSGIRGATSGQTAAAKQQAAAVQEVTSTLAELRQTSQQALEKAESVIDVSEQSVDQSGQGSRAVEDAIVGMREIRAQVEAIAEKILLLSEQTQQIGEIIASVNEISEQSKLLALNASIEAARAGEHGRGFSVVAAEIRSLAEQSKQATTQVRKILSSIQAATNSAVVATEEGTKRVELGVALANRAGENIQALARSIQESTEAAQLIVASGRQQTAGIEQVSDAMMSINQATASAVAGLRQTEEAAAQLKQTIEDMNQVVASFLRPRQREVEFRLA